MVINDPAIGVKHQMPKHIVGAQSELIRIITYTWFWASREESLINSLRQGRRRRDFIKKQ